nr:hypothetical protein B0A51_08897 [Rachicladosporium sp. CCFEE 5018]
MRASNDGTTAFQSGDVPYRTLTILAWAFLTIIWAVFTPPERTFAIRILLFQPLWVLRILGRDSSCTDDLLLTLVLHAVYSFGTGAWAWPSASWFTSVHYQDEEVQIYFDIVALLTLCGTFANIIVYRDHRVQRRRSRAQRFHTDHRIDEELLPPLLIPSKTTHTRLFPKKHSFEYSYLLVGVPVGSSGRLSNALSVDGSPPAWFDVRSADYLNRGDDHLGLADKLKSYLHTQGVTDRDYSFAYLVTAPRFLGYSFNPVSFWYLYTSDAQLKYMILEVNNTFDERRLYLLRAGDADDQNAEVVKSGPRAGKVMTFTNTWEKDFHVSPFNSRKGTYSLRAIDPLHALQTTSEPAFDNTIVLRSSKAETKLIARIFLDSPSKMASDIATTELLRFIARWWWVGLVTFPRIVRQAAKLFFTHSLHVWYRPEVMATSFGRAYTADERKLESFFRDFLSDCVSSTSKALRLVYVPPHADGADADVVFYSPGFTYEEAHVRTLTIRVLSPAFYGRFVHYAHAKEAFDRESLATDEKNRTMVVESAHLLPVLLEAMTKQSSARRPVSTPIDAIRWRILQHLRCPPPLVAYPASSPASLMMTTDIRSLPVSELDLFVRTDGEDASFYRRTCTKIFLAQRFAYGTSVLISAMHLAVRSLIILLAINMASHTTVFDVLRPRPHTAEDWMGATTLLTAANSVHLWRALKG